MNDPALFVRVFDPATGDHVTTTRVVADKGGLKIIDGHPALDTSGRPLPRKLRATIPEAKSRRKRAHKPHATPGVVTHTNTEGDTSADTEENA